jgi:competence protein ComGC
MDILYRYLLIVIACIVMLMGIQIPNLVDQYEKRVDAHLREVTINLKPYQEIANKYTGGSLDQLIELHRKSDVQAFQNEGIAIADMVKRKLRFEADLAALQAGLPVKVFRIVFRGDRELMDETLQQYTYAVPLTQDALLAGAAAAAIVLVLTELLLALTRRVSEAVMLRIRSRFS